MSRSLRLIMFGWLMATFLVMSLLSKPTPASVAALATRGDPARSVAIPGEWVSNELTFETQERGQGRFSIKFTVEADPTEGWSGKLITSATTQISACGYAFALDLVAKRTPYLFWDEFEFIGYLTSSESLEVSGHFPSPTTVEGTFSLNISDCHAEAKWTAKLVTPTPTNTPPTLVVATKAVGTVFDQLLLVKTISIQDDSSGDSAASPIKAHYRLKPGESSYIGTGNFSVRGDGFGGAPTTPLTATVAIDIPFDVVKNFLQRLMDVPLQTGTYEISPGTAGYYPRVMISIVMPTQTVTFFSRSPSESHSPWQVTILAGSKEVEYVSYSPIPADALETLKAFLKRDVLEGLIAQAW